MSEREAVINAILMDHGADSFAFNVRDALTVGGAKVTRLRSDSEICAIRKYLDSADLIVFGPGCDGPEESGNYRKIIELYDGRKPMFGLCLGHQTMLYAEGVEIEVLHPGHVKHGIVCEIEHDGEGIFEGVGRDGKCEATRYNSLAAYVGDITDRFEVSARQMYPDLQGDQAIVMGFRRKRQTENVLSDGQELHIPTSALYVGVQFHPESSGSYKDGAGPRIIQNLVTMVRQETDLQRHFLYGGMD